MNNDFKDRPRLAHVREFATATMKLLLKSGAKIASRDSKGRTPLHWAAKNGNLAAAKILLDAGALPSHSDKNGATPIDYAETAEMISLLNKPRVAQPVQKTSPTTLQVVANALPTKPIDVRFRSSPTRSDDIAVIIGNADYKKQGKDIPNVNPAYADAEGIKQYFMKAKGVREGNIIYLKDATSAQLTGVFGSEKNHKGQLFNWVKPNVSKAYIYYAGHGAPTGDEGSAYLVPSDATSETVKLTGYPLATLYKNLGKIPAKSP